MKVFDNLEAYAAEVGNEIGVSEWMVIDQDRINKFAEATGDHQWIHIDGERTQRELGMPTIAHACDITFEARKPQLGSCVHAVRHSLRAVSCVSCVHGASSRPVVPAGRHTCPVAARYVRGCTCATARHERARTRMRTRP